MRAPEDQDPFTSPATIAVVNLHDPLDRFRHEGEFADRRGDQQGDDGILRHVVDRPEGNVLDRPHALILQQHPW